MHAYIHMDIGWERTCFKTLWFGRNTITLLEVNLIKHSCKDSRCINVLVVKINIGCSISYSLLLSQYCVLCLKASLGPKLCSYPHLYLTFATKFSILICIWGCSFYFMQKKQWIYFLIITGPPTARGKPVFSTRENIHILLLCTVHLLLKQKTSLCF